jgi:hypothetical protein
VTSFITSVYSIFSFALLTLIRIPYSFAYSYSYSSKLSPKAIKLRRATLYAKLRYGIINNPIKLSPKLNFCAKKCQEMPRLCKGSLSSPTTTCLAAAGLLLLETSFLREALDADTPLCPTKGRAS